MMTELRGAGRFPAKSVRGSAQVFLADALLLPTGLVTVAILTRFLGPDGYGLFTLAATVIAWVAWSTTSMLERPSIALVAGTAEWQPVATTVVQTYAICGLAGALLFWVGADVLAALLKAPQLAFFLRLFAFELIVFALAQGHGTILVARSRFAGRAAGGAARWMARMALIVVLVVSGLSVTGAILGSIGGFAVELIVYRRFVRPSLFLRSAFRASRLWSYGAPLMLFALCLRLFVKIDLLAVKGFGGTMADAGVYGAAQNLAIPPALVATSLAPLILGILTRLKLEKRQEQAQVLAVDSLRFAIVLFAFAAAAAGSAEEVVVLLFGRDFGGAGPILALLIVAEVALVTVSLAANVLILEDRRGWISWLGALMVLAAFAGHALTVPRFGAVGAASVTLAVASLGAVAASSAVYLALAARPPVLTLLRTIVIAVLTFWVTTTWQTPGLAVVGKLTLVSAGIPALFLLLGEFGSRERALFDSLREDLRDLRGE